MKNKLWNNIHKELKDSIFNKKVLDNFISNFYESIVNSISENQHILFIFRIQLINNNIKTVIKLQKINNLESKRELISYIFDAINLTNENYNNSQIKSLIITYGIRKGTIQPPKSLLPLIETSYHIYYNHKLPIATKIEEYGDILNQNADITTISLRNRKGEILIIKREEKENRNHIKFFKNGKLLYEWTDHLKEDNSLIREIGKTTIFWKEGEIIWTKVLKVTKPISKKKVSSNFIQNFISMDLETISEQISAKNSVLTPYLLCWYDGKRDEKHSYFLNSNKESIIGEVIKKVMIDICIRKYKGYKIYIHNFSKFDAIFLIKYLVEIGKCDPVIHKGKFISFKFKPNWKKDFGYITFLDSYLLLPSSLKDLSRSFSVDNPKDLFPILFNSIDYKGEVPKIEYFKEVSNLDYENYKDSFKHKIWNFKEEAEKYCILDCISLFQVLNKFSILIWDKFKLNIQNHPTLPSLAFAIFRSKHLKLSSIYQISGKIDKDIREGYTGGSTDMFIPKPLIGDKIYCYDVNSLYPSVMKNNPYPVGNPTYFEGDILKSESNPFGFFYCKIKTPENLLHPILQLHHKTNNGIRTISPLGTWEGMYFSEELYNAQKYGYKFEVLRGYLFEKDNIFDSYINDLYELRLTYPKTDPMNYTAKLLLNSLYGRFGMDDNFNTIEIINQKSLDKLTELNFDIESITQLNSKYLVSYNKHKELKHDFDSNIKTHNINIAIAAAVTAYARNHMSRFKNNPLFPNLYYSDTDSLYFDRPLPDSFISKTELGLLKLEGIYDQALFLAPKVYALKNNNEEIIKIKGLTKEAILKNKINIDNLEILLNKDYHLILNQRKWFRSLQEANIEILEQTYNLKVTGNKRELIYRDNQLVGTKPILINI
jgi:hypothetical protein